MSILKQIITGGTKIRFPGGKYFFMSENTTPVKIIIHGLNNSEEEIFNNIQAPFSACYKNRFLGVTIYSPLTQTIKVFITENEAQYYEIIGNVTQQETVYGKFNEPYYHYMPQNAYLKLSDPDKKRKTLCIQHKFNSVLLLTLSGISGGILIPPYSNFFVNLKGDVWLKNAYPGGTIQVTQIWDM